MKKTKGFTLAEVLVGLSIVGITAALTIPQLVKTIQKVETGPKLSRAVQQFEVSSQDYFDYKTKKDEKKSHYTKFSDMSEVSLDELATFWGLTPITNGAAFNIDEYTEYAYIQQPLLIQSAYAAVQNNSFTVNPPSVGGDTGVSSTIGNGIGNTGTTTVVDSEGTNPDGTLKRRCNDILTGEVCYEDDPNCKCTSNPNNDDEDKETLDPAFGTLAKPCPNGFTYSSKLDSCIGAMDWQPDSDPEPDPEPKPDSKQAKAYHSKKGGYDVLFEDNKINTTGITDNKAIVASFYLDTNGTKNRPNMKGKDLFKFHLRNDGKLEPDGLKDSSYAKNCADSGVKDGLACTARIVRDGYKIKY